MSNKITSNNIILNEYKTYYNDFENIFLNNWSEKKVKEYLINIYNKNETATQIAACASVMREFSIKLPINEELSKQLIDNCGTGGDKSNSFNISTTVSIILSACNCKVAKHGNRSITSSSGSADMLEALGVNLNLTIEQQIKMLKKCGFVFMFAQNHHPSMKYIMPIRKSINHRTIFNILGPLTNPANVDKQLIGVFHKEYIYKIIEALKFLGTSRAIVVSSNDGMDEISISDITHATTLFDNKISNFTINPTDYGFKLYDKSEIQGYSAHENAILTKNILSNKISGAKLDIVLINAAVALLVNNKVNNIENGIAMAKHSIKSNAAIEKLNEIIKTSNEM